MRHKLFKAKAFGAIVILLFVLTLQPLKASAASGTWGLIGTDLGEQDFTGVASNSTGEYLAATVHNGSIYTSDDYGATWVERDGAGTDGWSDITISEDGSKLAVVPNAGRIWTSIDYGATWQEHTGPGTRYWNHVAASSDGQKIIASSDASGALGAVTISDDSGETWTNLDTGDFGPVGMSDDGQYVAYYDPGVGEVLMSSDGGDTWSTAREAAGVVTGIDFSSDGSHIVALDQDLIHVADSTVLTWSSTNLEAGSLFGVAMDESGQNIAVALSGDYGIYTSEDSGETWTPGDMTNDLDLRAVASNGTGERLIAAGMQRLWVNVGPPEVEDYNGDGISDADQSNLSSYVNPLTNKRIVIDVGENCEITTDDYTAESRLDVQDPAYKYENGLFDFAGDCGTPGFTTTVKLYYYDVSMDNLTVRKYNPNTTAYFNLTGAHNTTLEEVSIDSHTVTVASYQITDGGDLDMDLLIDGVFEDPAGVAENILGSPNTGIGQTIKLDVSEI